MQEDKASKILLQVGILAIVAMVIVIALFFSKSSRSRTENARRQAVAQHKPAVASSYTNSEAGNLFITQDFLQNEADNRYAVHTTQPPHAPGTRHNRVSPSGTPISPSTDEPSVTPLLLPGQNEQSYPYVPRTNPARTTAAVSPSPAAPGLQSSRANDPTDTQKTNLETEFSPYMAALTKQQAQSLEKQLNGLSDRVEAAIMRAFLPKSKKDANIEKYLSHNTASSTAKQQPADGKFAEVANQITRQKAAVMASVKDAFGTQAANEAGRLMNAYQNEIMQLLDQPSLTQDQMRQKARQISSKYNQQLQELSEKNGLKKLEEEHLKKDQALQNNLKQTYGDDVAGQLGDVLDKYRQKDLQLAQRKDLTEEEYFNLLFENQRQRHKELAETLTKNGQSLKGFLNAEDELEAASIRQLQQQEEQGNLPPRVYLPSKEEKDSLNDSIAQERNEKLQTAQNLYGETGAALINHVYDTYAQQVNDIMADEETSLLEKQQQLMQARQEANAAIEKIQNRPDMKQQLEKNQVDNTLAELMKDPALAQATAEQRKQFEQHARPILQQMYARINEVTSNATLSEAQKQQQIQAIQQEAQQQLSGQ